MVKRNSQIAIAMFMMLGGVSCTRETLERPTPQKTSQIVVEKKVEILPVESAGIEVWEGFPSDGKKHVARRLKEIDKLAPANSGVLFLGDSITELAPLDVLFPEVETINYGVSWDVTDGVLLRTSQIWKNKPDRLFIKIGTNDLYFGHDSQHIAENIGLIVDQTYWHLPQTEIFVLSILPRGVGLANEVKAANAAIEDMLQYKDVQYLDIYHGFDDGNGVMITEYSDDYLHLNEAGYARYAQLISDCVITGCKPPVKKETY